MNSEDMKNENSADSNEQETKLHTNTKINELQCRTSEQQQKIAFLSKVAQQKDDLINLLIKEKNILESEKLLLQREQQTAIKEKEIVVMRFAVVEKNLLDANQQLELSEKRERKTAKECDILHDKIKTMKEDYIRLNTSLSIKALEKEIQELKNRSLPNQKHETEDCSTEKLDELKANLIMLKHVNSEQTERITVLEQQLKSVSKELQSTKSLLTISEQERTKLHAADKESQHTIADLQNFVDANVLKVAELQTKINELEATRAQLSIANDANRNNVAQIEALNAKLLDQSADIVKQQQKEYELLTLNQELSSLNASLQNDILLFKSKSLAMSLENESIKKGQSVYELNYTKLKNELNAEKQNRTEERLKMAKSLAEKSKECEIILKKYDQVVGDSDALKKKNSSLVKDLQREILVLQRIPKKEDANESNSAGTQHMKVVSCEDTSYEYTCNLTEPSTSKLIDRIVRLQQANNRQTEKIEFLENHSSTLVAELQKKAKIIQHYMMKEPTNSIMHSEKSKLYNGILHAVNGNQKTPEISLDLVLEVNKKLQFILEDTLLKNITLKDNLDTLGLEVDRLTQQLARYS
ncbi:coiled-coil domain-containing protein 186 isoform X2 [Toxorhynchites rutilus septentrionalis]|uniref:coiled-coil domain-containing protein 186 isoform X2 n=1 Tax=Toxorhynchites rutilus septentrionalis TaxID=329112 RepID=UPI00247AED4D|nr:coiled-coil domain-containing protein 186 isoform X2 [Toxorhynchites rutilus septentrionalis]